MEVLTEGPSTVHPDANHRIELVALDPATDPPMGS